MTENVWFGPGATPPGWSDEFDDQPGEGEEHGEWVDLGAVHDSFRPGLVESWWNRPRPTVRRPCLSCGGLVEMLAPPQWSPDGWDDYCLRCIRIAGGEGK